MDGSKVKLNVSPCKHCGRKFVPESLVKHEKNCLKVQAKRKPFDPAKQRVTEDLSLKQIKQAQKKAELEKKKQVAAPRSHWRQKHEEFVRNIRAAKGAQVAMERGDPLPPPPPPSLNPDYVDCPYCSRRFNEKAAERHINFCKEQQKRLTSKREPSQQEKARAAAKTYVPPKPKLKGSPGDAPDSPIGMGGGYGGGSRGGPPAPTRGGPPAPARGGYSQAPAPAPGRSGPSGGRMGNTGPAPSKSDNGRSPGGYSSAGRGAPAPRGTKATQGYANNDSSLRGGLEDKPGHSQLAKLNGQQTNEQILQASDLGYHSGSHDHELSSKRSLMARKMRPTSAAAKFCHECGTQYLSSQVKFCTECGLKRLDVSAR
ncbi:zinc finger C2HC domain-containing protein 1A-like isoform X2 [Dreissena polymorpha]|uniref:zinc finger C2HC domain-containing protein 1A-like isoform X2 n=1 Tax=Dreissena polymorpha TaxID=45954 RepID=UPI0022643350|nr:zinc finger C2HC domain-containing protein 1A-like isoform X2 [Dreissena polymorpha]